MLASRVHALIISLIIALMMAVPAMPGHAQSVDLRQIMGHPAWMGNPVQAAWWQLDGDAAIFEQQRDDTGLVDRFRVDLASGEITPLDYADHANLDGADPIFNRDLSKALFIRDGNLFVRHLSGGAANTLTQITQDSHGVQQAAFGPSGDTIVFRRGGHQWWRHDLNTGLSQQLTNLRFEADPDADSDDLLTQMQLRLFSSLAEDQQRERLQRAEQRQAAAADTSRGPAPWYLGEAWTPINSALSPDGRFLMVSVRASNHQAGRRDPMPHYVTVDGYISTEDVRTRVGRNPPPAQQLWLLDLDRRQQSVLDLDDLSTIKTDPLAELRAANGLDPLPNDRARPVSFIGMAWHPNADRVAVQVRSNDNKDRWLAVLDPHQFEARLIEVDHLHDPAWINWRYNEFGWLPGAGYRLWFLSETSGYSHFHTVDVQGPRRRVQAHTRGRFEISSPVPSHDGRHVHVLANPDHPGAYDLYRLDLDSNELTAITDHRGIESFSVLPGRDGQADRLLLRYSEAYLPPQLAQLDADGRLHALTDTRSETFREMVWQQPQLITVPSSHGADPIPAKFYPARTEAPENGHPIVLFVHGAGYLQNVWFRYPQYFREQMFHNLLTELGYHVLDMDFRASAGYGRDWRTAIYRQMGTPELEDLIDGVSWLVSEHNGDADRVGLYGGSYGGFMTFMALFNAPEVFHAGAALRPVSDWAHYNHPYTSNILNTPELDPEAYLRSSPIEFAEGLQGHLLMTHGMLDDNVFYQDVVRLAQRLIDLEKENWELASYPLERHGFTRATSWLDQYRRILKLFEERL